ncbi:MAG: hypothetical protein Tsb005_08660 [Gammaproteobacteria bacterium]
MEVLPFTYISSSSIRTPTKYTGSVEHVASNTVTKSPSPENKSTARFRYSQESHSVQKLVTSYQAQRAIDEYTNQSTSIEAQSVQQIFGIDFTV